MEDSAFLGDDDPRWAGRERFGGIDESRFLGIADSLLGRWT
jgi:hypothetical protein